MAISTIFNYLAVYIDGERVLIPVESVTEVTKKKINRTLPGLKQGFLGIADLRREIIPVFSLSSLGNIGQDLVILSVKDKKVALVTDKVDTISMHDFGGLAAEKVDNCLLEVANVKILDIESIGKVIG